MECIGEKDVTIEPSPCHTGVDIDCENSPINLMLVSYEFHRSLHTDAYIARVYRCIKAAEGSRIKIYIALYQLRMELSAEDPYSYLY